jgi:hypothetical protein
MQQLIPYYNLKYPTRNNSINPGNAANAAATAVALARTNALYETG